MESPNIQTSFNTNSEKQSIYNSNVESNKFDQMMNHVECLIQHQFSIFVPAIILKYKVESKTNSKKEREKEKEKDFYGWDYNDLFEFFSNFGEIESLEIASNVAIILFKTFVDAYTSKEFLQNAQFKENEKNNFSVDWYRKEDEVYISEIFKEKIKKVSPAEILETIQENAVNQTNKNSINALKEANEKADSNNNFNYLANSNQTNANLSSSNEQIASNFNAQYNYFATWSLSPSARNEFNSILNNQPIYNINYNKYGYDFDEGKNFNYDKNLFNGKYTCKFEIQIENDNEFQVARRLIGAKGCNMKKVIELCSRNYDGKYYPDAVKLRLRGRGSGYKEGPYNRESDEPLHLCISSKYFDKYKRACNLVQELIINVYEEFKRFCERNGRTPTTNLTILKEENLSSKKNNNQYASNNLSNNSDYFSSDS